MKTGKVVLVLGAAGGIGGEIARQLLAAGWQVRAFTRGQRHAAATRRHDVAAR
jgi:NAD(P)-dependent dehydrogenase (short-subunit alcohol dehydrogenase family)